MDDDGTMFVDGVRYSTYPPPTTLIKVMKRCFAESLLYDGSVRFGGLALYKKMENPVLGDPNEGKGIFRCKDRLYEVGSMNSVYVWCASCPTITPERVNLLAKHEKYDCVVIIKQPAVLIQRLRSSLKHSHMYLHCSDVSYDKGAVVDKIMLNSKKFHFNIFQKDTNFSEDEEYRIALIDHELGPELPCRFITVGRCSDIMEISNMPEE